MGTKLTSRFIAVIATVAAVAVLGCAGGVKRGTVAMKVSENMAHVSLGEDDVQAGDTVTLYRHNCDRAGSKAAVYHCEKERLGQGTVRETLGRDYAVIEVPSGLRLREGDVVER